MVYAAFLDTIVKHFQKEFGDEYEIILRKIPKNNGISLDGLCISKSDFSMSPTIYLNPYYEQYQSGMPLETILQDIKALYSNTSIPKVIRQFDLSDFSSLKSNIMFKLIHSASNKELLDDIPHISYLDLAIVFYIHLDRSSSGQMTALIHNEHLKHWNIRTKDLWECALFNTPSHFPAEIRSIEDFIEEPALEHDLISPLFVLTNSIGLNGACCMLYQNVLKNFANAINEDLIILPSSIHEVLLTPNYSDVSYEELSNIVTTVNRTEVSPEDHLSNQVYLYTRSDDRIRIVSHGPEKVGIDAAH